MTLAVIGLVLAATLVWPGRQQPASLSGPAGRGAGAPWRARRVRGRLADLESMAAVADLLAMALRSGATPVTAVAAVVGEAPDPWHGVLEEVGDELAAGGAAGGVWRRHALHHPELRPVAGAWSLSEGLGVALAPSMATSAQVLRARVQARRRLDAATAGARSTMHLLTLLPLVGLLAGLVAQGSWATVQMYLHGQSFGTSDPQFGLDVGFYAFDLPFFRLVLNLLFVIVVVAFLVNLLTHYIFGGIRLGGILYSMHGKYGRMPSETGWKNSAAAIAAS